MLRLDDIARSRDDVSALGIGDAEQGLQAPQAAIAAPVLCQLDGRAREIAEFLQLALEALEQRESICRSPGKSSQYLAVIEPPHFARIGLHHALSQGYLAAAPHRHAAIAPHGQNGRAVNTIRIMCHSSVSTVGPTRSPFKPFGVGAGLAGERHRRRSPGVESPNACKPGWC